jgi:hypothetical protein
MAGLGRRIGATLLVLHRDKLNATACLQDAQQVNVVEEALVSSATVTGNWSVHL